MGEFLRRRISAALLLSVALAACDSSNSGPAASIEGSCQDSRAAPLIKHTHENGLQLSTSAACRVTTTPAGFVVEPLNAQDLRYPFTVSIELLPTQPEVTMYRVHHLSGGRMLWYSATHTNTEGSGDPEWAVIAFERVGDRWIQYRETKQDERQPKELWAIAQGLSYVVEERPR